MSTYILIYVCSNTTTIFALSCVTVELVKKSQTLLTCLTYACKNEHFGMEFKALFLNFWTEAAASCNVLSKNFFWVSTHYIFLYSLYWIFLCLLHSSVNVVKKEIILYIGKKYYNSLHALSLYELFWCFISPLLLLCR